MFFTKYPHPANFVFVTEFDPESGAAKAGNKSFEFRCDSFEGDYFHLSARNPKLWRPDPCIEKLDEPRVVRFNHVCWDNVCDFELMTDDGKTVVKSVPDKGFGVCQDASLFQFEVPEDAQFFGMGEKWFGKLELSGIRTKFWNTDVWSDFHWGQWSNHPVDPPYCSVPYLAMRTAGRWVGFLLHNPGVTFMETPGNDSTRVFVEWQRTSRHLILGSENGEPSLWVFHAATLAELTRKLQGLVGKTPLPPLWSLGFHQSRWGYGGHHDLLDLDAKFNKYEIPCSGLWLDLDYMDGFRIFEVSGKQFPKGVQTTATILAENDRRIVPIIDPGVKAEPGYRIYDDGAAKNVFCKTPEGKEFIGLVWPGETVFPDFTQKRVRDWFARYAKEFRQSGFGAAWIDMNDPSTGPVDPTAMLFNDGHDKHELHRNQYALGMQEATVKGFLEAAPDERPFLLSRSGFIGTSKYSAVWTGDNISNEFYLQQSIPTTLGMAISGIPFNGPDVGGFGGDASDELMVRWFQACMLFPFFRNHSTLDSRMEEPWRYPARIRNMIAHSIRTRYQFLPYLYQQFIAQERNGEAMVRPLIYDFDDSALADVIDECMIGPSILQAPIVQLGSTTRALVLPGDEQWFDLLRGVWANPGTSTVKARLGETPLYVRAASLVAIQPELPTTNSIDLRRPRFLLTVPDDWTGSFTTEYSADDGLTFNYRLGGRSTLNVRVEATTGSVSVTTETLTNGFGDITPEFALTSPLSKFTVNGRTPELSAESISPGGRPIQVWVAKP